MSDRRRRERRRRWEQTGSVADEARDLAERLRAGELERAELLSDALAGRPAALEVLGDALAPLSRRGLWAAQRAWNRAFAPHAVGRVGPWGPGDHPWHALTHASRSALAAHGLTVVRGPDALRRFAEQRADAVLLLPDPNAGFACRWPWWPEVARLEGDVYALAPNERWTLVITHEADVGPLFAEA